MTFALKIDKVNFNFIRILCETVKEFTLRMAQTSLAQGDEHFSQKCQVLNTKLALLVQILEEEGGALCSEAKTEVGENDEAEKSAKEKQEKDIINLREKAVSMKIKTFPQGKFLWSFGFFFTPGKDFCRKRGIDVESKQSEKSSEAISRIYGAGRGPTEQRSLE